MAEEFRGEEGWGWGGWQAGTSWQHRLNETLMGDGAEIKP